MDMSFLNGIIGADAPSMPRPRQGWLRTMPAVYRHECGEVLDDAVEFEGPYASRIGDKPYRTLTHGGWKEEGDAPAGPLIWTEAEAWHLFHQQIVTFLRDEKPTQIAWRRKPNAERTERGSWKVTARLAWWSAA